MYKLNKEIQYDSKYKEKLQPRLKLSQKISSNSKKCNENENKKSSYKGVLESSNKDGRRYKEQLP